MAIQTITADVLPKGSLDSFNKNTATQLTTITQNKSPVEKITIENKGLKIDTKA